MRLHDTDQRLIQVMIKELGVFPPGAIVRLISGEMSRRYSTGTPVEALVGSTRDAVRRILAGSDDRLLVMMPLFHNGACSLFYTMFTAGGTTYIHRKFEPLGPSTRQLNRRYAYAAAGSNENQIDHLVALARARAIHVHARIC